MLHVVFFKDSSNELSSVFAQGHVEIPETSTDEYSLVCAAVSAILQAARAGLEGYAGIDLRVQQEKGDLRFEVPEGRRGSEAVKAILATAELAVSQIARQYPEHVSCETRSQA